ncbi:MAG: HEAT repeat domain-containing protein [Bdellovibrionales bacterium]|nr:HEAT repeat domain-containing protein [Bdellovibrionales bacterium]
MTTFESSPSHERFGEPSSEKFSPDLRHIELALRGESAEQRITSIQILAQSPSEGVTSTLLHVLLDTERPQPLVARAALEALVGEPKHEIPARYLPELLERFPVNRGASQVLFRKLVRLCDADELVRKEAKQLTQLAVRADNPDVRALACEILAEYDRSWAARQFRVMLNLPSFRNKMKRRYAASALAEVLHVPSTTAEPKLDKAIEKGRFKLENMAELAFSKHVRWYATDALGQFGGRGAAQKLVHLLSASNQLVRQSAFGGLCRMLSRGDAEAAYVVLECFRNSACPEVRFHLAEAMEHVFTLSRRKGEPQFTLREIVAAWWKDGLFDDLVDGLNFGKYNGSEKLGDVCIGCLGALGRRIGPHEVAKLQAELHLELRGLSENVLRFFGCLPKFASEVEEDLIQFSSRAYAESVRRAALESLKSIGSGRGLVHLQRLSNESGDPLWNLIDSSAEAITARIFKD